MKRVICFAALLLWGSAAFGESRLKKLNVVALDGHGQAVTDLKAADFQIFEDGKAKPIAYFRYTGGKTSRTTVILVDLLSDRLLSDSVIGREVAETLKKLESSDDVYLYFLTSRGALFPVHGLPDSGEEAAASAEPWTRNAGQMVDIAVKKLYSMRPMDDYDFVYRFQLTKAAIEDLGGQMQQISGRKNLLWIGHGTPLAGPSISSGLPIDLSAQVQELAERLERAQIAVYAVQQSMQGAGQQLASEGQQTLSIYTNLTGGRRYGSDTVDKALLEARTDSQANYQIAYYTDAGSVDRKRHKVRVASPRKDLKILTESEFYDLGLDVSPVEFEMQAVSNTAKNAMDATEIGITASHVVVSGKDVELELQVDGQDLLLRPAKDRYVGNATVSFAMYNGGELLDVSRATPLPVEARSEAAGPLLFKRKVQVDARATQIRAIVVDRERGAVGSVTIPLRP